MVKVFSPPEDPQQTNLFHFKKNESSLTQKLNAFIEKRFKKKNRHFSTKIVDYQFSPPVNIHSTMTVPSSDPDFLLDQQVVIDGQVVPSSRPSNPVAQTLDSTIDPGLLSSPHFLVHSPSQTFEINQSSSNIQTITFPNVNDLPFDPARYFRWNPELSFFAEGPSLVSPSLTPPPPPPPPSPSPFDDNSSPVDGSAWGRMKLDETRSNLGLLPVSRAVSLAGGEIDELNSLYKSMKIN